MKIRKALFMDLNPDNKWMIIIRDDEGHSVNFIAIPPTKGNRTDIYIEYRTDEMGGTLIKHKYMYNFKGNIKKLREEMIIIKIENGIPSIDFKS